MVKFSCRLLVVILGNLVLFYYMAVKKSVTVDDIVFYLFCLNILCAYFTKENKSFAPFRIINYRIASSSVDSVQNYSVNLNDKEEVAQVLHDFQAKRNYIGLAFFITSMVYLAYGLLSYFLLSYFL